MVKMDKSIGMVKMGGGEGASHLDHLLGGARWSRWLRWSRWEGTRERPGRFASEESTRSVGRSVTPRSGATRRSITRTTTRTIRGVS
jgi:hypothetical protein